MNRFFCAALTLVCWGCSDSAPATDAGAAAPDRGAGSCECDVAGAKRCAGDVVEVCAAGRWEEAARCDAPLHCFVGQCVETTIACPTSVRYDGYVELARRELPVQLGQCLDGGTSGQLLTLQEASPAREQRGVIMTYPNGCALPTFDLDAAFGFDVESAAVSSAPSLSFTVPAGEQGVFYRQTSQLRRIGLLLVGDKVSGTVIVSDFDFSYAGASGPTCPPAAGMATELPMQPSCAWHDYACVPCAN